MSPNVAAAASDLRRTARPTGTVAPGATDAATAAALDLLVARCALADKVRLLAGTTAWDLPADEGLGLRPGLDLVAPGPGGPWEDHLVAAVRAGDVDEQELDDTVRRVLRLAVQVGAVGAVAPEQAPPSADEQLMRELAARGAVGGHRARGRSEATPAALSGASGTTWRFDDAHQVLAADSDAVRVEVDMTNTGPRRGTETVQVHLEAEPVDGLDRPARWLAGLTTVTAEPGTRAVATARLPRRAFEVWDAAHRRWTTPPVRYRARIGRSVHELPLTVDVVPLGVSPGRLGGARPARARR